MPASAVRSSLEVLLTRAGLAILPHLSRRTILVLSRLLGCAAYGISVHLRRVGRANLDVAFGDSLSQREKRSILIRSFQTFSLVILDSCWFSRRTEERVRRYVQFDPACEAHFRTKAQICVTAHLGNWEVLGLAFTQHGYPLVSVAAPLINPGVDILFNKLRELTGQKIVSKHGAVRLMLKTLKENGKIALLLDQNTRLNEGGEWVTYFGLPVSVSPAAAILHERTHAEIIFGACLPHPDGIYRVPPPEVLHPDAPAAAGSITQQITSVTERWVRARPECWMWTYKRWKYVAPGHTKEEYPFYAKTVVTTTRM